LRASEAGTEQIDSLDQIVPLLLPHTAFKSYPETFLAEKQWDRMTRWLGTLSSCPMDGVNSDGIEDIDGWIDRLAENGIFVSCSSGTTGKPAVLAASAKDIDFTQREVISSYSWGSGVMPEKNRIVFGTAPRVKLARSDAISQAMRDAFGKPVGGSFDFPAPPITIGTTMNMILLRKAIGDGTALPADVAAFEEISADRQKTMADGLSGVVEALIAARKEKLYITAKWAGLYEIAKEVEKRGYAGQFNPENAIYVGGGLKGADVPSNYREIVFETFNIRPERNFEMYGMQEIHSSMPRCREGGRYHIPVWLICLPLNRDGDQLLPDAADEFEGRAAFFDLSLEGRWGGVISGDRIEIDYSPCKCGASSPSIRDSVIRYSDIKGDDKIACAGTVDAYVRGMS
jgi:hypothetical protein